MSSATNRVQSSCLSVTCCKGLNIVIIVQVSNILTLLSLSLQMARHAWRGYVQYAWGDNELKPISKRGHSAAIFGKNTKVGATIVDSLDTLFLMGLMDEFNQGKEWVQNSLNIDQV